MRGQQGDALCDLAKIFFQGQGSLGPLKSLQRVQIAARREKKIVFFFPRAIRKIRAL